MTCRLKYLFRFSGILILLSGFHTLCAQPSSGYIFENYHTGNGLSDNRVTCLFKDRTGFMWIGTQNGLNRFDGRTFLIYNTGIPERYLSNPAINDIEQDSSGRLWVATQLGLNIIDTKKNVTEVLSAGDTKNSGLPSDLVWDIFIDKDNRVWLAPDGRDLCYYDIGRQQYVYFPWKEFVLRQFPHHGRTYISIRKIFFKSADEFWLGTTIGLVIFNKKTGQFTRCQSLQKDHFIALQPSADGQEVYYIQNPLDTLQVYSLSQNKLRQIPWHSLPVNRPIDFTAENTCWLPAGNALIGIQKYTGYMTRIMHETDHPRSLQNGIITVVYKDNDGLVWVGGNEGFGKFSMEDTGFRFIRIWEQQEVPSNSENDFYPTDQEIHTVFYSEADNNYYISSPAKNCLVILNKTTGWKQILTEANGIALKKCSVIYEDAQEHLWILANNTAFIYDRAAKGFSKKYIPVSKKGFLTDMATDDKGNYWFSSFGDGLYHYNMETDRVEKTDSSYSYFFDLATCLYFDRQREVLWAGNFSHGIYRLHVRTKKADHLYGEPGKKGWLPTTLITDIAGDTEGNIWIATYGGGIATCPPDAVQGQFSVIGPGQGLAETNIYSLTADKKGAVWATTYNGLVSIRDHGKEITPYYRNNHPLYHHFYGPLTITGDNELLTGANNGFISMTPYKLHRAMHPFPVVITEVGTRNSRYHADTTLLLPHTDNQVHISFAALSYFSPSQTSFEYRLQGIETAWNTTQDVHAVYNALPPGKYTFQVRAKDHNGQPSANTAQFSFTIQKPWWMQWLFIAGCAAAAIALVTYLLHRRIRSIKTKALIQQQMAEWKSHALRAQMNPHFIFNSLNSIQELIITENYAASYQYLAKFSKLLRTILHVSEKNLIPLSDELAICRLYLELEALRFKNAFRYSIETDPAIDTGNTLFPTLLIQPFIENAIWHGLLPKKGSRQLDIFFSREGAILLCKIADNGIGRNNAQKQEYGKGRNSPFEPKGISLVQQRAEMLREIMGGEILFTIADRTDAAGRVCGTCVTLRIPYVEIL